jgi:hypothetical protein
MLNALFGYGGIANAGLMAKQAYNVRPSNTTRKNTPVATPTRRPRLYNNPAELTTLKQNWTVNDTTYTILEDKTTDELDALFKHYLKTKKGIYLDFKRDKIGKEGFNVIDTATSQYLEIIKKIMREKAILMLAGKTESDLRKLIAETNKLISQVALDVTKVPDEQRIDMIVEKEHLQFFLTLLKEGLERKKTNLYAPSTAEAPSLNTSYLNERNFSLKGREKLNNRTLRSSFGRNKELTNSQRNARRIVAMKMARGEPVTHDEKYNAGIVKMRKPSMPKPPMPPMNGIPPKPSMPKPSMPKPSMPKPSMPKPSMPKPTPSSVGGRKTRRNRKH